MLDSISAEELAEWRAFDSKEPIGGPRLDILAAMEMAITANLNRRKGTRARGVREFIPDWWKDSRVERSPDQLLASVASIHAAMGGELSPRIEAILNGGLGPGETPS